MNGIQFLPTNVCNYIITQPVEIKTSVNVKRILLPL